MSVVQEAEMAWEAVCARDGDHDGAFVYAVVTTGVYCRPSCPARRPLRKNVRFFALGKEAQAAGFRPCKRCKPDQMSTAQRDALAVEAACRTLESADQPPTLAALAQDAGLSPHHFHRIFKAHTGLTPKAYAESARTRRATAAFNEEETVAGAAFKSGFQSLSRFYDAAAERFGLAPAVMRVGGQGEVIVVAQTKASLGWISAAFSRKGVAAIILTDDAQQGIGELMGRFRHALLIDGGADFEGLMEKVVAATREPQLAEELPLDIRGTAFEERVWAALRKVPIGTTSTYGEIAQAIGAPNAHRAVAKACGSNRHAIVIPCHRIVRADGSLAGYRWGVSRKKALLAAEANAE